MTTWGQLCCSCRPSNQFCCGCSLKFGAKFILIAHLLLNVFYIATSVSNIILRVPTAGFGSDLTLTTFNAGFCLFGLPFIVAALYGVSYRQESHVRLYLYYMLISFLLDMCYVFYFLVIEDSCTMMPAALKKHGSAFACGVTRSMTIIVVLLMSIFQLYFIYTIWSMAEDIKAGGTGTGFPELLETRGSKGSKFVVGEGIFGTRSGRTSAQRPLNYGSLSGPGLGGGTGLFGGTRHEVSYPPRGG